MLSRILEKLDLLASNFKTFSEQSQLSRTELIMAKMSSLEKEAKESYLKRDPPPKGDGVQQLSSVCIHEEKLLQKIMEHLNSVPNEYAQELSEQSNRFQSLMENAKRVDGCKHGPGTRAFFRRLRKELMTLWTTPIVETDDLSVFQLSFDQLAEVVA